MRFRPRVCLKPSNDRGPLLFRVSAAALQSINLNIMSGCVEDILVDLSEPAQEPAGCYVDKLLDLSGPSQGHEGIHVTDSVELFRADKGDNRQMLVQIDSPLFPGIDSKTKSPPLPLLDVSTGQNASFDLDSLPIGTIDTEKFDFDLPLTPSTISERTSSVEDLAEKEDEEEEVFFGPVGFRERCAATVVDSTTKSTRPLSPLNDRQMAEIFKEAQAVANRISSAVSKKKSKSIKDKLTCSKQLNMDKRPSIFSPEAVGKLLQAVSKTVISDADSEDKENIGAKDNGNGVTIPVLDEAHSFAIASVIAESIRKEKEKSSGSDESNTDSPSRRHIRNGIYTVSKTQHDELQAVKRKSMPVVQNNEICDKESKGSASETKRPVKKRSLQPPSKMSKGISKLQGPAAKKPHIGTSPPQPQTQPEPVSQQPIPVQEPKVAATRESKLKPRSGLPAPKGCSALPSKLKVPGAKPATTKTAAQVTTTTTAVPTSTIATTSSSIPTKGLPVKSGIPGLKGKCVPVSKLQLIKPSGLHRPAGTSQAKGEEGPKKTGPLKAFNPAVTRASTVEKKTVQDMVTPAKEEKHVKPKNLSSNFSTPKSGSTSSVDSPVSSVNRRRSFLPTPSKSRTSSSGSLPSPSVARLNSTSSFGSPALVGSTGKRRASSVSKTGLLIDFDDSSPSAMKPKKQLVTNTPNLPKRKISPWSPVEKQRLGMEDQAIVCTKKFRK